MYCYGLHQKNREVVYSSLLLTPIISTNEDVSSNIDLYRSYLLFYRGLLFTIGELYNE